MTKTLSFLRKHPYWPCQMAVLLFNVLSVFIASTKTNSKVYVIKRGKRFPSERKCNQEVTGCLTFDRLLQRSICTSFYRSRFKYWVRSLHPQHSYSHCSSKTVSFMSQSDLDPRTIDLNLHVNPSIEVFYQCMYENVAQLERLNYWTITTCLRKGSVYRCKIT